MVRDPKRKTGYFTESQINAWLARFEPRMRREAANLWKNTRVQTIMPSQEAIADFLKDRLRWYLEIFSPDKKILGKTLNEKIRRYGNTHISFGIKDIFTKLERKKLPRQISLFHEFANKAGGKSMLIESLEAKTSPADKNVQEILDALKTKGLHPNQRVLVLAKIAGMQQWAIARTLGVHGAIVSRFFSSIEKGHALPVINPKLSAAMRLSNQRKRK